MTLMFEIGRVIKRAHAGDAASQFSMAQCYDFGFDGVEVDKKEALMWYRKAAVGGHREAREHLSYCHRYGVGGVNYTVSTQGVKNA